MSQTQTVFVQDLGLPQGAVAVNRRAWFQDLDGNRAVFVDQTAFYCYPVADPTFHRFCAAQLVEAGIATVREVCSAFDLHPRTFSRWRTSLRQQGIAGLVAEKVGRKPKSNPTLAAGIVQCYRQGLSTRKIGTRLGISPSTVQRILRDEDVQLRSPFDHHRFLPIAVDDRVGSLVGPEITEPQTDEPQTDEPRLVEATSIPYASPLDRFATTMGWIEEAPVVYESADNVPYAGVLLGLALLEDTHLVQEARAVYGRLKNGWYGLRSLLWTLVAMALLRIKRPEQLKHHDPAELGRVLGMPRAAEVKTVRRKLFELSLLGKAAQWHRELARRRVEQQPMALVSLYVDGHLRAYHGQHRIEQTRVSRLNRVMRAEDGLLGASGPGRNRCWSSTPSADSSFREALCNQRAAGDPRSRRRPPCAHRVRPRRLEPRVVPATCCELNFDFVTYRKGAYEPLPDSDVRRRRRFHDAGPTRRCSTSWPNPRSRKKVGPRLRLIAVKRKNGGQTHVLATGNGPKRNTRSWRWRRSRQPPGFRIRKHRFRRTGRRPASRRKCRPGIRRRNAGRRTVPVCRAVVVRRRRRFPDSRRRPIACGRSAKRRRARFRCGKHPTATRCDWVTSGSCSPTRSS
jgi:transposase